MRGERRSFFGCLHASPLEPSDTSWTNEEERVNARSPLAWLASPDGTSMPPLSRARGAFRRGSPGRAPSRAPALEPCSRWPTGAGAARVHRGSRTSTRPFSAPLSRAFHGRVRFDDLCRSMFQRARRWTSRASRAAESMAGMAALSRSIVASRSPATAEGAPGQGSRITEPRPSLAGLLPKETLPRPRLLRTPLVAVIACRPVWSRRGRRAKPPALRALARRAQREGGAAPDLREEIRRAFARGAFRRKAVREREPRIVRGQPVDRALQRLFHCEGTARGTLARGLRSSASR